MGETLPLFSFEFNRAVKVEFRPERITAEVGALLAREVLDRSGLIKWLVNHLVDPRNQDLITHPMGELLRTALIMLVMGWRDQDDADALRDDPTMRLAVSDRHGTGPLEMRPRVEGEKLDKNPEVPDGLASQPTLSRLVGVLAMAANAGKLDEALLHFSLKRIRADPRVKRRRRLTIDVDSAPIEVHGHQPFAYYNGHYHSCIYHPLLLSSAETGDLMAAQLRPGWVHTADGALDFITPLCEKIALALGIEVTLRFDAGFPEEELCAGLESRKLRYTARLKNNAVLDRMAEPYLNRPVGRPPEKPRIWLHEMQYRAGSWSRERRVVLVVCERHEDPNDRQNELFLHHFWLVTSFSAVELNGRELLEHYRERGTAEGHMGELMSVLEPALSSSPRVRSHYRGRLIDIPVNPCDSFAHNEVILLLNLLAYEVMHTLRRHVEETTSQGWSLQRLRERVLRLASRVVLHGRRAVFVVNVQAAKLWQSLLPELMRWRPAEL